MPTSYDEPYRPPASQPAAYSPPMGLPSVLITWLFVFTLSPPTVQNTLCQLERVERRLFHWRLSSRNRRRPLGAQLVVVLHGGEEGLAFHAREIAKLLEGVGFEDVGVAGSSFFLEFAVELGHGLAGPDVHPARPL